MRDDVFGESDQIETQGPPKMVVPARAVNSIEAHLCGQMASASLSHPPPFVEEDESNDFDGLPLRHALDLRDLILSDIEQIFRRQIICARDLGPDATTAEYETACLLEGVEAWPVGDALVINPPTKETNR